MVPYRRAQALLIGLPLCSSACAPPVDLTMEEATSDEGRAVVLAQDVVGEFYQVDDWGHPWYVSHDLQLWADGRAETRQRTCYGSQRWAARWYVRPNGDVIIEATGDELQFQGDNELAYLVMTDPQECAPATIYTVGVGEEEDLRYGWVLERGRAQLQADSWDGMDTCSYSHKSDGACL